MIAIIANPKAHRFSCQTLAQIKRILKSRYRKVDVFFTQKPLDALKIAKQIAEHYPIICSFGGDGTLNEVLNGIVDKSCALAVIPAGTSDVFALEINIGRDPIRVAENLLNPKTIKVNLGKANERYFILMAGIGLDSTAVLDVNHHLKKYSGKFSYIASGIKAALNYKNTIEVITPKDLRICYSLIVANAKKYGGNVTLFKNSNIFDNKLSVYLFYNKPGIFGVLSVILSVFFNISSSVYECIDVNWVRVETPNIPIQVDGDFIGYTKATIQATNKWIKVAL